MKILLLYAVLLIFSGYRISGNGSSSSSELIIQAQLFHSSFGVPYRNAITYFANLVIQPLAQAPVPATRAEADPLVATFTANIGTFNQQLLPLSNSSDQFVKSIGRLVEATTTELSEAKTKLANTIRELELVEPDIVSARSQQYAAWRRMNAEKTRQMIGEAELQWGGKNANGQTLVANYNKAVSDHTAKVAKRENLLLQQQQATAQKASLSAELPLLQTQLRNANDINSKIRKVLTHLTGILDKGTKLRNLATDLISMEELVNPLLGIVDLLVAETKILAEAQQLTSLRAMMDISASTAQRKLPKYPLW